MNLPCRLASILTGILCTVIAFPLPSTALTADISGTVVGSGSSPIAGCTVFIKGTNGLASTTDAQGGFTLKGMASLATVVSTGAEFIRTNGQSLELSLQQPTTVTVDLFSLSGRRIGRMFDSRLAAGTHRLNPLGGLSLVKGLYLLNARIGSRHFTWRVSTLGGISRKAAAAAFSPAPLAKAAAGDTLVVDCDNLPNAYVSLPSLTQNVGTVTVRGITKKPNFMLILADDLTATDLGCMGNPDVITPAIDSLAKQGMLLDRAFCATAMCAPIRMSLYSSMFPVRNGGNRNHGTSHSHIRSVVHHLGALGYRVGLTGKRHFKPIKPVYPFDFIGSTNGVNLSAIKNYVTKDTSQPYCLFVCSKFPHGDWVSGDRTPYDAATVRIDPYHVDTKDYREAKVKYYAEINELDKQVAGCMKIVDESPQKDNTMLIFASEQGASWAGGKWTLWEPGTNAMFAARFPEVIRPGTRTHAMVDYVDVVPTFIDLAGGAQIDSLDGRSFMPVLFGKKEEHRSLIYGVHTQTGAGTWPKGGYAIRSIRTKTHKYIWNLQYQSTYTNTLDNKAFAGSGDVKALKSWTAIQETDAFAKKIIQRFRNRPEVEFYDLTKDPWELNSIAEDPAQRPLMDSLRTLLEAWMTQQGDKGILTEQGK